MAQAVERAFTDRRHLIVEAGTGTGKTLAYLLPALRQCAATGQRVIISTGTKNLQEQLFFKDVPFLESMLGPLRVCYMKGRANYLCRHKLFALRSQPILSGLEEISQYQAIADWEKTTETGDRAEIDDLPEASALWSKLDARSEACLGQTCPDYRAVLHHRDAAEGDGERCGDRESPPVLCGYGDSAAGGRGSGCGGAAGGRGGDLRRGA